MKTARQIACILCLWLAAQAMHAGSPLALLYFPGGVPKVEFRGFDLKVPTVEQSRHMKGSYLARMKDWFGG